MKLRDGEDGEDGDMAKAPEVGQPDGMCFGHVAQGHKSSCPRSLQVVRSTMAPPPYLLRSPRVNKTKHHLSPPQQLKYCWKLSGRFTLSHWG